MFGSGAENNSGGGYTSLRDMVDGGGAGRSGDKFVGGLRSGLLNAIGVRPLGYNQRQAEMQQMQQQMPQRRPMARPQGNPMMVAPPPRPEVRPMQLQPISQQPLVGGYGGMDEYTAAMLRAINSAPQAQPMMSPEQLVNVMRGYY